MRAYQILAIMSVSAAATVHAITAPIEGYGVWIPQWDFEVTPGGPHIVLNGTVEQVLDQLHSSNPKLLATFNLNLQDEGALSVRDETDPLPLDHFGSICHEQPAGNVKAWWEGIKYLEKVPGRPVNGPGPGQCGRVSCSYNTQIWWCNDVSVDTKTKTLSTFRHIANGAQAAYNDCTDWEYFSYFSSGQAFHKRDNWNVIVRGPMKGEGNC
ncbi:hypothetical protein CSOJ01_13509 [Colletotrichum sojae]|uniref:Secreted protein n=1 Tax=Colletotrichum sojae TaxID=2175907 RepID=A0A8H6ML17_9PEZI|nr:hypothetical protein CSOJ01_13509 [Colletotrichum sojae]